MNSKVSFVLGVIIGASVGAVASYNVLNSKYEERIKNEVNSVKETYSKMQHELAEQNKITKEEISKHLEDLTGALAYTQKDPFWYREPADIPVEKPEELPPQKELVEQKEHGDPYEITKEEFGGDGEYRTIDLNFYSDGTLTDDDDIPIDNAKDLFDNEIMTAFDTRVSEGHEDIYIRNPDRGTDYRINLIDVSSEN